MMRFNLHKYQLSQNLIFQALKSIGVPFKSKQPNSRKKCPARAKTATEGKKSTKRSTRTRRTAEEQVAYDRTMESLDYIIGKNAEDAVRELEDEEAEEEDNRPRTRGRKNKNL